MKRQRIKGVASVETDAEGISHIKIVVGSFPNRRAAQRKLRSLIRDGENPLEGLEVGISEKPVTD